MRICDKSMLPDEVINKFKKYIEERCVIEYANIRQSFNKLPQEEKEREINNKWERGYVVLWSEGVYRLYKQEYTTIGQGHRER